MKLVIKVSDLKYTDVYTLLELNGFDINKPITVDHDEFNQIDIWEQEVIKC